MNGMLASLSAAALLAAPAVAQCLNVDKPGWLVGVGDDATFAPHYDLGFFFPMVGSLKGGYTHFRVSPNGWLMLTNGLDSPGLRSGFGSVDSIRGDAHSWPCIAPFWRDLDVAAPGGVYVDNSTHAGQSCTISWVDAVDYSHTTVKSFQVELFATGEIRFAYAAGMNVEGAAPAHVAVCVGNGIADPGALDLSVKNTAVQGILYEIFPTGMFDLGGKSLLFVPDDSGGWTQVVACRPAENTSYGLGCYDIASATETLYQAFDDAAVAWKRLEGNALRFSPNGNGYGAAWLVGGATAFVTPTNAAAVLPVTDDGATTITPSRTLPIPGGAAAQLTVSHNGILTIGSVANNAADYTPSGAEMAATTRAAFYAWHDYNDTETGSGRIKTEEVGNLLYVTWDRVENWSTPDRQNPGSLQFQLNLVDGSVTLLWAAVDQDTTSPFGSGHVVGYTGPTVSADPGSTEFAVALPLAAVHARVALRLSADVPPVCTPLAGTTVVYTTHDMPQFAPGAGSYIGMHIVSFGYSPPFDLAVIGAPGCFAHILSTDIVTDMVGFAPAHTTAILFPPGTPAGLEVFAQSVALFDPAHPLPNGQNAFGMLTSNAIASHVAPF